MCKGYMFLIKSRFLLEHARLNVCFTLSSKISLTNWYFCTNVLLIVSLIFFFPPLSDMINFRLLSWFIRSFVSLFLLNAATITQTSDASHAVHLRNFITIMIINFHLVHFSRNVEEYRNKLCSFSCLLGQIKNVI